VIAALSFSLITTATIAAKLGLKDPIIVERGCFSKSVSIGTATVTDLEIKSFVEEVLPKRFGTAAETKTSYLSSAQLKARATEMDDLLRKGMQQTLLINRIDFSGDVIRVDADRLISIAKIRSAFPMTLDVEVSRTTRTEDNPYGLILTKVSSVDLKELTK
jgi:hypothetical protein